MMTEQVRFWQRFDYVLFGATLILIVFGIMMIASATQDAIDTDLISRVPDQINFAIASFIVTLIFAAIDYRLLGGLHMWLYGLMIFLLLLVPIVGVVGDAGAQRWINVGIRIQPSEIGKILVIITLSHFLSKRYREMDKVSTIFKSLVHVAVPAGLIFIQPDLGTTIVFFVIWGVIIWSAGLTVKAYCLDGLGNGGDVSDCIYTVRRLSAIQNHNFY